MNMKALWNTVKPALPYAWHLGVFVWLMVELMTQMFGGQGNPPVIVGTVVTVLLATMLTVITVCIQALLTALIVAARKRYKEQLEEL